MRNSGSANMGDAEIGQLHLAGCPEQNVLGRDVAMDEAEERAGRLPKEVDLVISELDALYESGRCLNCCRLCYNPDA